MKWDGHTHSQFCKHGSERHVREYVAKALELEFTRYTITEHPPVPERWIDDEVLMRELAMDMSELRPYTDCVRQVKDEFAGQLEVTLGLEMDYLHGHEAFSEAILSEVYEPLEDLLISVHYLPARGGMRCIDYKPEDFREHLLGYYGTMAKVVDAYYDHVELAIRNAAAWKLTARKRLGHINLIEKFRLVLPSIDAAQIKERLVALLPLLQSSGLGIDVNTAGIRKSTCGIAYVPDWFMEQCHDRSIPLVYGSDAHHPRDVGSGWEWFHEQTKRVQGL
jgi:histidinol-phosphatase (PHP family)